MRFGVCAKFDRVHIIQNLGYDYIEANLSSVASMTEEEIRRAIETLDEAGLACECSNCFFPSSFNLVGDSVDYDKIAAYADGALCRAKRLGIKVAVLGSGKTRRIPDGFDRAVAVEQFEKVVSICSDAGRKYGIKIALEPLNTKETNLINTVGEGYVFCKELGDDNVGMVADLFHMFMMKEDVSVVEKAKDYIFHIHMARPNEDRKAPGDQDLDTVRLWAENIKKADYDGRISLECSFGDQFEECVQSITKFKHIFE